MEFFTGRKQNTVNQLAWKASCTSLSITLKLKEAAMAGSLRYWKSNSVAGKMRTTFDYTDAAPSAGVNYYRLKMTEADAQLSTLLSSRS